MARLIFFLILAAQTASAQPIFEDRSNALEPHIYDGDWVHFVGGGVAVFDCNNDGLPEIYAAGGENDASLFLNRGEFAFERLPQEPLFGTVGAYPLDIDNDGKTDIFVLRAGQNRILKGLGDCAFEDATEAFNVPADDKWSTAFSAWWLPDNDLPTLAIGNYVDRSDPDGPFEACDSNILMEPSEQGYSTTNLEPGFCPLSILAARDGRGRLTLRLSNDRHYYVSGGYEQMWDIEDRRYLGAEDGWENVSLWGMGIASRDLTGDGRDEVMLTSMGDQLLQIAQPDGSYAAAPYDIGTYAQRPHVGDASQASTGWHAEFGDIDNDGLADLFMTKGNVDDMPNMALEDPNNLLMQDETGQFDEMSVEAGVASTERSRGAALADFDGDGRLDILVSNRRAPLEIYRNITPNTGNWLQISLRQSGANRDAIGAVIEVNTDRVTQSQQNVIGGGHASGHLIPKHFGVGQAKSAEIVVTWPDGSTTRLTTPSNRSVYVQGP